MSLLIATLTGAEWVGVIGAAGAFMVIIGGVIVSIINAWKTDVSAKLDVIKGSVDGTASKQDAKLSAALEKLEFMTRQVSEQRQTAAVLAATAPVVTAPALVVPPPATNHVLDEIAQHTKETAENTAKEP